MQRYLIFRVLILQKKRALKVLHASLQNGTPSAFKKMIRDYLQSDNAMINTRHFVISGNAGVIYGIILVNENGL